MDGPALSEIERRALRLTEELWGALAEIVGQGPTREQDLVELLRPLQQVQKGVLAQAAARCYPAEFRLLGQPVSANIELVGSTVEGHHPPVPTPVPGVEGWRIAKIAYREAPDGVRTEVFCVEESTGVTVVGAWDGRVEEAEMMGKIAAGAVEAHEALTA